jgi:hypothetical protein
MNPKKIGRKIGKSPKGFLRDIDLIKAINSPNFVIDPKKDYLLKIPIQLAKVGVRPFPAGGGGLSKPTTEQTAPSEPSASSVQFTCPHCGHLITVTST